ncbi:MAG: TIM barrel protein [Acetobacteraceae bacterium]|nr:TIM barrel protein [Acetobacteraceae bacterium]
MPRNGTAHVLDRVGDVRPGCCLDTCHLFSAGYDFRGRAGYEGLLSEVDRTVGPERVKVIHLNDSRGALGERVDRHVAVGAGEGLAGVRT